MYFINNLIGLNQKELGRTSYPILVPRSMSSVGKTPALRVATHPASPEMLFSKTKSCSCKSNWSMALLLLHDYPQCVSASLNCLSPQSEFLFCHLFKPFTTVSLALLLTLNANPLKQTYCSALFFCTYTFTVFPFLPTTLVLNFYFCSINNAISDFKHMILHSTVTSSPFIALIEYSRLWLFTYYSNLNIYFRFSVFLTDCECFFLLFSIHLHIFTTIDKVASGWRTSLNFPLDGRKSFPYLPWRGKVVICKSYSNYL